MSKPVIAGEYYFRKMELVAGFYFSADGTFQFFYSYGAVDRSATGTFSVEGNTILLQAEKTAGADFKITSQSKQGTGYHLQFTHPNTYLLEHIRCIFFTGDSQQVLTTNASGEVHAEITGCDKIYAQHMLYPDIATLITDNPEHNNTFSIALQPSLEQVSFKGIDLTIENENALTALPNYLLPFEGIRFLKS